MAGTSDSGRGHAHRAGRPGPDDTEGPLAVWHPLRILLAEDDPGHQEVALELLDRLGYRPDVVSNGQDAVDAVTALGARAYDLVFLDVDMPVLDGVDAAREIRKYLGSERPRLVGMTIDGSAGERTGQDAGMDAHITKPLHDDALQAVLRETKARAIVTLRRMGGVADPFAIEVDVKPVGMAEPPIQLDPTALESLAKALGGAAAVRDLVAALDQEAPVFMMDVHRGLEVGDPKKVQAAAEALKSLFGMFGLVSLRDQAAGLEVAAQDEDFIDGEKRLLTMMESFEDARGQLRAHLGSAGA